MELTHPERARSRDRTVAAEAAVAVERDRGVVLVMTLVLMVLAGAIAGALASYATTTLRTSAVTDQRIEARTSAVAAVEFAADMLATTDVAVSGDPCAEIGASITSGFWPAGVPAELECAIVTAGTPMVFALAGRSGSMTVTATVEVRPDAVDPATGWHPVAVTSWTPPQI